METSTVSTALPIVVVLIGARTNWDPQVILLYNDAEKKLAEDCVHRMVKRAIELEGTVTVSRPLVAAFLSFFIGG